MLFLIFFSPFSRKRDVEYNTAVAQMKERYEKELKDWHSKLVVQTDAQTSDKM